MHPMRRGKYAVTDTEKLKEIIDKCDVIRVAMSVNNIPYIVPMNFGYGDNCFYFHGAKEGRKIDMIKANPQVCFELDTSHQLTGESERACDWTMKYESIIGTGTMSFIEDFPEKVNALNIIMQQYGGKDSYTYEDKMLERINILKLTITEMCGKVTTE